MSARAWCTALAAALGAVAVYGAGPLAISARVDGSIPRFDELLARPVRLKAELRGVHPRVFMTEADLAELRRRAAGPHRESWQKVLRELPALKGDPPPVPGPQERRSQNNVAFAIAGVSFAYAIEQKPAYLAAARKWIRAAIDYEPWGYTYNKPNVDLAAGHLLYAIGWAYDLLFDELTPDERGRIRASLERHATLVHDHFAPGPGKRFNFTQNHDFIPTAGLAVAALALLGESHDAEKWAALARAHHHRANQLLSPDGYYYEGMEYWIFSVPWLVHFYNAWEHSTGESLWELGPARNWKYYLAHTLLPDGQNVFDYGDIWEGALTRARTGAEYNRVYPGGTLQSNFNLLFRVASRLNDPEAQAVAERFAGFGHSNLEEYWTLAYRDPRMKAAAIQSLPLHHHFEDMGVVYSRTSWGRDATAVSFKAGPPEGHRAAGLVTDVPEWALDSGHSHPDNGSFIIWAGDRYLTGDTGYAGLPHASHHNTITVDGVGQGVEGAHDVWRKMDVRGLDAIRITRFAPAAGGFEVEAELAAAYPAAARLSSFRRRFTFAAPTTFAIRDVIETSAPRTVQWYLQSDIRLEQDGSRFIIPGDPSLLIEPQGRFPQLLVAPTVMMAPGKPGSITKGTSEPRGHHLLIETARSTRHEIDVRLEVRPRR